MHSVVPSGLIKSLRCAETEIIFNEEKSRKFGNIQRAAFRKLVMLHAVESLSDLARPGAALEALQRDRKGQHAIRLNERHRICFLWLEGDAHNVEIVDYH